MGVYIIAEIGVNHNGDINLAKEMIQIAAKAGVDCVKFQTFIPEKLTTRSAPKAEYQKQHTQNHESQMDMLKKLTFSYNQFRELYDFCDTQGIQFASTAFDEDSASFLNELGVRFFKIPSGEITNYPYLKKIAGYQKPVIISTGMCNMQEIHAAVDIFQRYKSGPITLLHCTTEYPARFEQVNLSAMNTLKKEFPFPVGYSDHTKGIEISVAAVAMGAQVIEKHFTLSRDLPGPDHQASLEPMELIEMVQSIRHVEAAIGDGQKVPSKGEIENLVAARKSIVAKAPIHKGDIFTEENLTTKRPGGGISPMKWDEIIGQRAVIDFDADEMIRI